MTVLPGSIVVEVGFGSTGFDEPSSWTDVSAYVRSGSITRGGTPNDGVLFRVEAGTASIVLDNTDARFTPTNLSGPYVSGGVSQVLPMVQFRVRSSLDSGYALWQGFADSWDLEYPGMGADATCTLHGTDAVKIFQAAQIGTFSPEDGNEYIEERVPKILASTVAWPTSKQKMTTLGGSFIFGDTTYGSDTWSLLVLAADSELGDVYIDGGGNVVARGKNDLYLESRSATPQGTFSNDGNHLGYVDVTVAYDDTQVKNVVSVLDGGVNEAVDFDSELAYGVRELVRTDLMNDWNEVGQQQAWQNYVLSVLSNPELRLSSLTVNPGYDPTNLNAQVLGRELGDRITVKITSGDYTLSRDAFIRGIEHTWGPATWQTLWRLQDATRYNFLVFDNATLGKLDSNRFNY